MFCIPHFEHQTDMSQSPYFHPSNIRFYLSFYLFFLSIYNQPINNSQLFSQSIHTVVVLSAVFACKKQIFLCFRLSSRSAVLVCPETFDVGFEPLLPLHPIIEQAERQNWCPFKPPLLCMQKSLLLLIQINWAVELELQSPNPALHGGV